MVQQLEQQAVGQKLAELVLAAEVCLAVLVADLAQQAEVLVLHSKQHHWQATGPLSVSQVVLWHPQVQLRLVLPQQALLSQELDTEAMPEQLGLLAVVELSDQLLEEELVERLVGLGLQTAVVVAAGVEPGTVPVVDNTAARLQHIVAAAVAIVLDQ